MRTILTIYNYILDLFFPKQCVGCGKYDKAVLCYECASKIDYVKTSVCLQCGKISKNGRFCFACRKDKYLSGVLVATVFDEGPIREMLHHFKYNGIKELGELFGDILVFRIQNSQASIKNMIAVPVPLYRKRKNARGYNQSEIIARHFSKRMDISGGLALSRVRDTKSQVGLSRKERIKNVRGAFLCTDAELVRDKSILLIDDVVTTGGTLNECARVLREAGAKKVYGLVVAKRI